MEQRTTEWLEIRKGRFTSSEIYKLIGTGKKPGTFGYKLTDWSDTAQAYILSKAAQHFTTDEQQISSIEMRWGVEHEPQARATYEGVFGVDVEEVGFILWPGNTAAGCSPDGLITSDNRGLEIKCPFNTVNHAEGLMLRTNADLHAYKPAYYWQVMSSLMFTGFDKWDFVSYHPFFIPQHRIACIEIVPEKAAFEMLAERIAAAVQVRDAVIEQIKNR